MDEIMAKRRSRKSKKFSEKDEKVNETIAKKKKESVEITNEEEDSSSVSSEESEAGVTYDHAQDDSSSASSSEDEKKRRERNQKKRKKKKKDSEEIEVEFIFCDMNEKFFHGIKTLLQSSTIFTPNNFSSSFADCMIDHVEVGTIVSTEGYDEDYVYGLASIIPYSSRAEPKYKEALEYLQADSFRVNDLNKAEMNEVLRRNVGIFFQERFLNLPLLITYNLHSQLLMDLDWAKRNDTNFKLDTLVRIAPCYPSEGGNAAASPIYKYFDDEIFATNALFSYDLDSKYVKSEDDDTKRKLVYRVIVISLKDYQRSVDELKNMINIG